MLQNSPLTRFPDGKRGYALATSTTLQLASGQGQPTFAVRARCKALEHTPGGCTLTGQHSFEAPGGGTISLSLGGLQTARFRAHAAYGPGPAAISIFMAIDCSIFAKHTLIHTRAH